MAAALVVTEETAQAAGYAGAGPFTFPGVFPGEFTVGQPVRATELGFVDEDEARAAYKEAFKDVDVAPLDWVDVGEGEGYAVRANHALSEDQARPVALAELAREARRIRTHEQADQAAADAGMPPFPTEPRPTVTEKVEAIEAFKAGGTLDLHDGPLLETDVDREA